MEKDKITKENLKLQIKEMANQLLEMAKEHSWNTISNNIKFVIKKIKTDISEDEKLFETNRKRKRLLNSKERLTLESAIKQLNSEFEKIYLIELFVFKASKKETIVEIAILEKSQLDIEIRNRKEILESSPMLHSKVAIPPYIEFEKKDKFDINWQLETMECKWKMFWWRKKMKKKIKAEEQRFSN